MFSCPAHIVSFPVGRARARCTFSRRLPGKLISAGSCGRAAGGQPGMSARPTAFRFSVRRARPKPVLFTGTALGLPKKGLVNARRRCVETRALPAGGLSAGGVSRGSPRPGSRFPDPAGELARDGGVGLARVLAGRGQSLAAAAEPGGALVGARPYRRGDVRARRRGLRAGRAHRVVPCRLYQRRPDEPVAGLGYPAAPLGLAARALRGREPAPAREGRGRAEPAEGPGLRREPEGRKGVDPLDMFVASKMLTKRHVAFEHFGRHVLHCFFALPSIKAASMRWLAPLNSTSLPWWTILSIMADASLSSPRTVPHFENSMFVVNIMLRLS